MNLQPIQPTDYGLSTEKAQNISMRFSPKEINDPRTKEVLKKFEAFKKWALTLH